MWFYRSICVNNYMNTKPRISEEKKKEILEYLKTHNQAATAKYFNIGYNTISFWINPWYKKYSLNKTYENYDKILENSKKYSMARRKNDPEYVKRRNEDAKRWQKEKRKNDPEWNKRNIERFHKWYKKNGHTAAYRLKGLIRARRRRAKKLELNEVYTEEDQAFTFNLFKGKCAVCGSTERLEIDHWRALSKGNPLTRKNAVLLCKPCNCSKGNKEPEKHFATNIVDRINITLFYL